MNYTTFLRHIIGIPLIFPIENVQGTEKWKKYHSNT
jgi:hypothetical protein